MPGYGNIARRAKQPGSVTAQVKIGDGGTLAWLDLQAPDKFLAQEVEVFLRYNTRFRADCRGQQITVVYTFVLRGDPVTGPNVRVTFRGPNEFVLESQPQLPIVDVMPAQASGPDPKGVDKKKK